MSGDGAALRAKLRRVEAALGQLSVVPFAPRELLLDLCELLAVIVNEIEVLRSKAR